MLQRLENIGFLIQDNIEISNSNVSTHTVYTLYSMYVDRMYSVKVCLQLKVHVGPYKALRIAISL